MPRTHAVLQPDGTLALPASRRGRMFLLLFFPGAECQRCLTPCRPPAASKAEAVAAARRLAFRFPEGPVRETRPGGHLQRRGGSQSKGRAAQRWGRRKITEAAHGSAFSVWQGEPRDQRRRHSGFQLWSLLPSSEPPVAQRSLEGWRTPQHKSMMSERSKLRDPVSSLLPSWVRRAEFLYEKPIEATLKYMCAHVAWPQS